MGYLEYLMSTMLQSKKDEKKIHLGNDHQQEEQKILIRLLQSYKDRTNE